MILVRPAAYRDIRYIAKRMREGDKDEVRASSGLGPEEALSFSFAASDTDMVWTAIIDEKPAAMFGAAPMGREHGAAWLLGTDKLLELSDRNWLRLSRQYIQTMNARYPLLMNYVDDRNEVSQRWLRHLGFVQRGRHSEYGVARIPFSLWSYGDFNV